jgi:hypothetical protein
LFLNTSEKGSFQSKKFLSHRVAINALVAREMSKRTLLLVAIQNKVTVIFLEFSKASDHRCVSPQILIITPVSLGYLISNFFEKIITG